MSELRERIARALFDRYTQRVGRGVYAKPWDKCVDSELSEFFEDADAVIAEMGLREERRTNPMSSAGYTVDRITGEQTWHSDIRRDTRWVTDWKADDE